MPGHQAEACGVCAFRPVTRVYEKPQAPAPARPLRQNGWGVSDQESVQPGVVPGARTRPPKDARTGLYPPWKPMNAIDKNELVAALLAQLRADLAAATEQQLKVQAGATHEENRAEGDKDMRSMETSYLARGQAQRVAELAHSLGVLAAMPVADWSPHAPAAVGALVELEEVGPQGPRRLLCLLAPSGGGLRARQAGREVLVVTPKSPLGKALLGHRSGDWVELTSPQGPRELEIAHVS